MTSWQAEPWTAQDDAKKEEDDAALQHQLLGLSQWLQPGSPDHIAITRALTYNPTPAPPRTHPRPLTSHLLHRVNILREVAVVFLNKLSDRKIDLLKRKLELAEEERKADKAEPNEKKESRQRQIDLISQVDLDCKKALDRTLVMVSKRKQQAAEQQRRQTSTI